MRSTDEILQASFDSNGWPDETIKSLVKNDHVIYKVIAQAIRQAQIEAIEECAEKVEKVTQNDGRFTYIVTHILQLKNEIR